MADGPVAYTAIGGGGDNPPHGEDFFNRIVNVHWPSTGPTGPSGGGGGLFVAGFDSQYGDVFSVYAGAASQDNERPGFVLGGGVIVNSTDTQAQIYFSSNGSSWSKVWGDPFIQSDADRWHSFVQAMVWNPDIKQFYAEVWQSEDHGALREDGTAYLKHLKYYMILLSSSDGVGWGEIAREMVYYYEGGDGSSFGTIVLDNTARGGPGLIGPYCSGTALDGGGNPLPDGVFSHWEIKDLDGSIIESQTAVTDPPPSYSHEGGGTNYPPDTTNILLTHFKRGLAPTVITVSPGIALKAVAFVGNVLVAAGGNTAAPPWGPGQIAISSDAGKTWKTTEVGTEGYYTIVVGAPSPPNIKPAVYAFNGGSAAKVGDLADILTS